MALWPARPSESLGRVTPTHSNYKVTFFVAFKYSAEKTFYVLTLEAAAGPHAVPCDATAPPGVLRGDFASTRGPLTQQGAGVPPPLPSARRSPLGRTSSRLPRPEPATAPAGDGQLRSMLSRERREAGRAAFCSRGAIAFVICSLPYACRES